MKKTILAIISLTIITFTGCYDPDSATVRINLGNIPIANNTQIHFIDRIFRLFEKDAFAVPETVQKVHIAAYSGGSLVASLSLDAAEVGSNNDVAELEVPAGENITFLVIGQGIRYVNDSPVNYAQYFGLTTTDISAGETKSITVNLYQNTGGEWSWDTTIGLTNVSIGTTGTYRITWNSPGFPVKYFVYDSSEVLRYEGYDQTCIISDMPPSLYLEFEPFNLRTAAFIINW